MDPLTAPALTLLKQILHPKGNIYHGLKSSENSFKGFGEAYFTSIKAEETKGWKKHTRMVMNLIVPVGDVRFHFYEENTALMHSFVIGHSNYGRLTVPPGWWTAFHGVGEDLNLILNIASIPHHPDEAETAPLDRFPLGTI